MWYRFTAWNSERLHGWTQDPAIAQAVVDRLNVRREVNLYGAEELGEDCTHDGDDTVALHDKALVCNDDTTLADFAAEDDA